MIETYERMIDFLSQSPTWFYTGFNSNIFCIKDFFYMMKSYDILLCCIIVDQINYPGS